MHDIHWNKVILPFLIALIVSCDLSGQFIEKGNINYWEFRNKPFYFGLTIGMHSTGYIASKSSRFSDLSRTDNLTFVGAQSLPGLNVNIITNLKIGQYFDFRFIPGFAFSERKLLFSPRADETVRDARIESVFLEIPLLLRFKSDPYKDKRFFVLGGLKYSYDVSSTSSARQELRENLIQIAAHDFQLELGAGMQFFFPFFIFSPEIKFSRGLNNIHIYNDNLETSRAIDKILSRTLSISLNFEG